MNLCNLLSVRLRWLVINILLYNFLERKRKKNFFCFLKVLICFEVFKVVIMRCYLGFRIFFGIVVNECVGFVLVGIWNIKFVFICFIV